MKHFKSTIAVVLSVVLLCTVLLTGCSSSKYGSSLDATGLFKNKAEEAMPQTIVYDIVKDHFENSTSIPKALMIALDGSRADSLLNILDNDVVKMNSEADKEKSAMNYLRSFDQGGLYFTYAGSPEGQKLQKSDTAPGFASLLTGVWADEHGVTSNEDTVKEETPTILKQLALNGKNVSFAAVWDSHFNITYKDEMALGLDNYVFNDVDTDAELHEKALESINNNDDCIFMIYEDPDGFGHNIGFSNKKPEYVKSVVDSDRYAYELIQTVVARETYDEEDWLIIMFTDHGGTGKNHGTQKITDRLTYVASNKDMAPYVG